MIDVLLFCAGFFLLIKGADALVEGASALARFLRISEIVVGLVIVSFGTSLPELVVNLSANLKGQSDLAVANILGVNALNMGIGIGLVALFARVKVKHETVLKEIPLALLAIVIVGAFANDFIFDSAPQNIISRTDGIGLLALFAVFSAYTAFLVAHDRSQIKKIKQDISLIRAFLQLSLGLVALVVGGEFAVKGSLALAKLLNISEGFVGMTIVALGTGLPEMITSTVAARKNMADLAIGNLIGSCIFNVVFILGLSAVLQPLVILQDYTFLILAGISLSLMLVGFLYVKNPEHKLNKIHGFFLIGAYFIWMGLQFYRG